MNIITRIKAVLSGVLAFIIVVCALSGCEGAESQSLDSLTTSNSTSDINSDSSACETTSETVTVTTSSNTTTTTTTESSATSLNTTTESQTNPPQTIPPTTETEPPKTTETSEPATITTTTTTTTQPPKPSRSEPIIITPKASGSVVYKDSAATIDASNAKDGYIMVKLNKAVSGDLRIKMSSPTGVDYVFQLNGDCVYEVIPLSEGSGNYTLKILKRLEGNKASTLFTQAFSVSVKNQFAPFLAPNQYVNYNSGTTCVDIAADLCGGCSELQKVENIYHYVIDNISYDKTLANSVTSGYLPNLNTTISKMSGICFDYASVMAAMLRTQGIPTKVAVGYAGEAYHAWISVYITDIGWIDGAIYFDGTSWQRMDPTYAASSTSQSDYEALLKYIGNGSNYTVKYYY